MTISEAGFGFYWCDGGCVSEVIVRKKGLAVRKRGLVDFSVGFSCSQWVDGTCLLRRKAGEKDENCVKPEEPKTRVVNY